MAEQGNSVCGAPEETPPGVTLTEKLIITRRRWAGSLPTATLRLDRENISSIGKLRTLEEVHSLYLQQNRIEKIENLDSFPNLRFLCLAGNRIQRVENLQPLPHLCVLDLSRNQIRVLDTEELPRSLQILDLTGNKCTFQHGYRDLVVAALPNLVQLDARCVDRNTAEDKNGGGSSSSEEEEEEDKELFPELNVPFSVDAGFFAGLQRELARRSQRRWKEIVEAHEARMEELRERRKLLLEQEWGGAAGAEAPQRCQRCPQANPGTRLSLLAASTETLQAPGDIQPRPAALEKETRAEEAGNRQLSQISHSSEEPQSQE